MVLRGTLPLFRESKTVPLSRLSAFCEEGVIERFTYLVDRPVNRSVQSEYLIESNPRNSFKLATYSMDMINSLDEIPEYIQEEVRDRIGARGDGSTLIIDESEKELLLAYTGFTDALKREYKECL